MGFMSIISSLAVAGLTAVAQDSPASVELWPEGSRPVQAVRGGIGEGEDGGGPYPTSFTYTDAIGHEPRITRRDPSDVLKVGDTYYVWYSKVAKGPGVYKYPSGYSADVWFASSPDGRAWTERGKAVGKGGSGAWDEHGVFTPNILVFGGKYYLFYTGVAKGFPQRLESWSRIGVAIGDSPEGPWTKFDGNPVIAPSKDPEKFDSMVTDDASLAVRGGKVWFYYKGRQQERTPGQTKMGVAISDGPTGPFVKHGGGEPLHPGHEVMIWPQGKGIASLATAAGPRRIYFAADGLKFEPRNAVSKPPRAPGAFRSDGFKDGALGEGLKWGISHVPRGGDLFLARFDARYGAPPDGKK